ncbi:hypothetical protein [Lysobacter capsici]|uniref:hypothetical protein n=1 Tax=Lysobacter capsici TaxID=435897 RepID=UPI0007165B2E|nr:hypothetical protein [Lysobacter capsici]
MLIQYALRKSARKLAPSAIPIYGEGTRGQDYYSTHVFLDNGQGESVECVVDDITARGVKVREWDANTDKFSIERVATFGDLDGGRLSITHYLEGHQFRYNTASKFFWEFFGLYRISILFESAKQVLFNKQILVRQERIDVLKNLLLKSERGRDDGTNTLEYQAAIHGVRFIRHPDYDASSVHYRRIFDSLVESGELNKEQGGLRYWVTPKALITLAAYETEERKHRDMLRPQKWIVWLTLLLLFGTAAQACVAYLQYQRDVVKDRAAHDLSRRHAQPAARGTATLQAPEESAR